MASDRTRGLPSTRDGVGGEVMASVDGSGDTTTLIIADVTADDVWLAMPVDEAPTLPAWR